VAEKARSTQQSAPGFSTGAAGYLALALGWSALSWAGSAFLGGPDRPMGRWLFLAGGAGPPVLALILTHIREEPRTRKDFWVRIVDPRRIGWRWAIPTLLAHPAIVALAFLLDVALGGAVPHPAPEAQHPLALSQLAFFVFWFGPLPEEIGWRGFALDRLQLRMRALRASLVLGAVWALWHVPLFFVPGTFQHDLGIASVRFWLFLASILPLSVLITWVYNSTRRSTLAAVLFHFSGNLCGEIFAKSDRVAALELGLLVLAAVVLTIVFGSDHLSRQQILHPTMRRSRGGKARCDRLPSGGGAEGGDP
jgi:membrane protease YdiL (CAAX protease family)